MSDSDFVQPRDRIRCKDDNIRYVVACMYNCPQPHYCERFWEFFRSRGLTPAQYYNPDGIGEAVMRRMVFDCDRCQKKDVSPFYSLYSEAGEGPEFLRPPEERRQTLEQMRYAYDEFGEAAYAFLEFLEATKGWQHYCDKCFQKICDSLGAVLQQQRLPKQKATDEATASAVAALPRTAAAEPQKRKKAS